MFLKLKKEEKKMNNQINANHQNQSSDPVTDRLPLIVSSTIAGLAVGAIGAYFLDPHQGKRRRARVRDQMHAQGRNLQVETNRILADVKNRLWGLYIETRFPQSKNVDDETLKNRVRSEFGRKVRHPRAIETVVTEGIVILSGPIQADEVSDVLKCVRKVPGVKDVIDNFDIHETADALSSLQGSGPKYLQ
jgi:hypothetical protein